jgi:hypothetical protein
MPKPKPKPITEAEHLALLARAHEFVGCTKNSPEEKELAAIASQLAAYERR